MCKSKYTLTIIFIAFFILSGCKATRKAASLTPTNSGEETVQSAEAKDNSAVFIEANKQKLTGNFDEAIRLFKQCLTLDPGDAASMFELANLYLMANRSGEALSYAESAAMTDPDNVWYQILYAETLQKRGNYAQAVEVFTDLTENHPENLSYRNRLALAYLYNNMPEKAIDVYDKIEEDIGVTEEISLKKQGIYLQQNEVDKAIGEIEKLIDTFPYESKYYAVLAEVCLASGKEEKAVEAYEKILEIDPLNPYVHISLADYYRKKDQNERAFEELKAGFYNPNLDVETKIQVIITYYSDADDIDNAYDQAFELSEILVETHPRSPEAFSVYGDFLAQSGEFIKAREAFRKVISIDSSRYMVWEQLLLTESELNDTAALMTESARALELFPEQPLLYLLKASAHYQYKEWEECAKTLESGLYFIVDNPQVEIQFHTYLGDAYHQMEQPAKSDSSYEKVLQLDPDNKYVLNNYAYYLSLRNASLDKAARMAKRATELEPNNSANQDTYGWVLYKLGYYQESAKWIEKALQNGGMSNPVILEHYGDVLYRLDRKEEAFEYWEKARDAGKGSSFLEKKIRDRTLYE